MTVAVTGLLAGCHGVDPLLANPPPATKPDVVLRTPYELAAALDEARRDIQAANAMFATPLWGDGLAQPPDEFRLALARQHPGLAASASQIQAELAAIFSDAAELADLTRQIEVRLGALDDIRARTNFVSYINGRKDLYNQRADARRERDRYGGQAGYYGRQAATAQATASSYAVERIDYVNSAGRVVETQYTSAHTTKQNARAILPWYNAAAREMAEKADAEAVKEQRLNIVIAATHNPDMESVEEQMFAESDRITSGLWPRLEQKQREVRNRMGLFHLRTGASSPIPANTNK